MRARTTLLATLPLVGLVSCGEGPAASSGPRVVHDTIGDTVVVRTVSGSVWGEPATLVPDLSIGETEGDPHYLFGDVTSLAVAADGVIYVLDRQSTDVRAFDVSGVWMRTLGRRGEGPGELKRPDGVAVLSDGRVLVRDGGNQRIQTYGADGDALEEWPFRTGFYTSDPLWSDREDNVYAEVLMRRAQNPSDWRVGLIRYGPDGEMEDTVPVPRSGFDAPHVEGHSADGGANVSYQVPFAPSEQWTLHPDGYFVHGVSTDYRIDLLRAEAPPLRIERSYDPVAVQDGEKEAAERSVVRGIQATVPDWKWNGPSIPDHKPPFGALMTGRKGRLWVVVRQPATEEPNPDYDPGNTASQPTRWGEPTVFDVFQPDGTYLGRVGAPPGFSIYPRPFFRGDTVWAVTRDELGVQRVVRFHVAHGGSTTPSG
jgi:hypothetical protein